MAKSKPRQELIHALNGDDHLFRQIRDDRKTLTLCGVALWYKKKFNGGATTATVCRAVIPLTSAREQTPSKWRDSISHERGKGCSKCRSLALMGDMERARAIVKNRQDRAAKAEVAAITRADARHEHNAQLEVRIAEAQIDALVILDHFEATQTWLTRCTGIAHRWSQNVPSICNLPNRHAGACRGIAPHEKPHVDIRETLAVAIQAQKHAAGHNDRGKRLFKMKTRFVCHACKWAGHAPLAGGKLRWCPICIVDNSHRNSARCVVRPDQAQGFSKKDVVCRFCDELLEGDVSLANVDETISDDTKRHTTLCALKFLARAGQATNQTDEPLAVLPAQSFVLEYDR